jgi:hypothetical protein
MRSLMIVALCSIPNFCAVKSAIAGPSECADAVSQYNSAADGISTTLRRYASCVVSSKGHDDCSTEFRRLKSAQSDFESAVSEYESECN